MKIERYDGGYIIRAGKNPIIITDEELRIADAAEKDEIKPAFYGSNSGRLETAT